MRAKKLLNKIKAVQKIDEESLTVTLVFESGKRARVSLAKYFAHPKGLAAEVMRGEMFNKCFVEMGALAWPNGLEFCADSLLLLAEEQKARGVA